MSGVTFFNETLRAARCSSPTPCPCQVQSHFCSQPSKERYLLYLKRVPVQKLQSNKWSKQFRKTEWNVCIPITVFMFVLPFLKSWFYRVNRTEILHDIFKYGFLLWYDPLWEKQKKLDKRLQLLNSSFITHQYNVGYQWYCTYNTKQYTNYCTTW